MVRKYQPRARLLGFGILCVLCAATVLHLALPGFASDSVGKRMEKVRQDIRMRYPGVRHIRTAALADWLADTNRVPPLLLDVREEAEYAVSHLQGARRVEPGELPAQWLQMLARDRPIVVYCSVGERSSDFASTLQGLDFSHVFNLDGSIFQWANEGRPLFSGNQAASLVHPYDRRWGRLLEKTYHPPRERKP